MEFFKKTFEVNRDDWIPEALDKQAIREANASDVKAAIKETMVGNQPIKIDFVDKANVQIAQMTASGAMLVAAPLNKNNNWESFVFTTKNPPDTLSRHKDWLFGENRAGNDSQGFSSNDPFHLEYHGHISKFRFPINVNLPASKQNLPEVGGQLAKKLFEKFTERNKA